MIYVSTGTHREGFDRLVRAVDNLIASGKIRGKVVMQIGNSKYLPKHCAWFRFRESTKDIDMQFSRAAIIITHAGAGSIISAMQHGKPTIVVPRLRRFGEHSDDHQLDLCQSLEKARRIVAVYDVKDLGRAIGMAARLQPHAGKHKAAAIIQSYLWSLQA